MSLSSEQFIEARLVTGRPAKDYTKLIQAIADGCSIEEAAAMINMNKHSADSALSRLRTRHGVNNTTHLVAHFIRNGWVD